MKINKLFSLAFLASVIGLGGLNSAMGQIILFEDTFNDTQTTVDASPNGSVSGVLANLVGSNYNLDSSGAGPITHNEDGGFATFNNGNFGSAIALTTADFATNSDLAASGILTIEVDQVTPSSADWFALSITNSNNTADFGGNPIVVNDAGETALGALFIQDGTGQAFEGSSTAAIPFNFTGAGSPFDIRYEITDLVLGASGSFDYEIFVNNGSVQTGSVSDDLSSLFISLESRDTTTSTFDNFRVSTVSAVPEPSSLALFGGLSALAMMYRRRR